MGPGFVHPGNRQRDDLRVVAPRASMGPGFVHPGNAAEAAIAERAGACFNGARVCTPGKYRSRHRRTRGQAFRFNGARVCTPGKSAEARPDLASRGASMGPGFVHPGNYTTARPPDS